MQFLERPAHRPPKIADEPRKTLGICTLEMGTPARKSVPILDDGEPAPMLARCGALTGAFLGPRALGDIEADWRDLARDAVEQNPFYAPWMLQPALAQFPSDDVSVACLFDGARLVGLLPLTPARGYARLPARYLTTWTHEHCFYAAPLVRRGYEAAFWEALLDLVDAHPSRPSFLRLQRIDANGALAIAARASAASTGRLFRQSGDYERAVFSAGRGVEDYLCAALCAKKRKELRRLRRRLEDRGPVALKILDDRGDVDIWCTMFLALERAGWKGREGTAIASSPASERFFRAAVKGAFDAAALKFLRLDAAEGTVAMIVNFVAGGEGYSFKIAHDPAFARYSPGVMLEIEMMKAFSLDPALRFVDSCASADHAMINSLWMERRTIAGLNISASGLRGRAGLAACGALENARARFAMKKAPR